MKKKKSKKSEISVQIMNCLKEEKRKTEDGWESIQVAGFEKSLWEEG